MHDKHTNIIQKQCGLSASLVSFPILCKDATAPQVQFTHVQHVTVVSVLLYAVVYTIYVLYKIPYSILYYILHTTLKLCVLSVILQTIAHAHVTLKGQEE